MAFTRIPQYGTQDNYHTNQTAETDEPSWATVANYHAHQLGDPSLYAGHHSSNTRQIHQNRPLHPSDVPHVVRLATQASNIHKYGQTTPPQSNVSPFQFAHAKNLAPAEYEQHALPGMSMHEPSGKRLIQEKHPDETAPSAKQWAQDRHDWQVESQRRKAQGPQYSRWSGPDTGQGVLGPNHAHMTAETDPHGFVVDKQGTSHPDSLRGGAKDLGRNARDYYRGAKGAPAIGGGNAGDPKVDSFWNKQPMHQVRADTPIHTTQNWKAETETGHGPSKTTPEVMEGRERINRIRGSMEKDGFAPEGAPWLVKHNNRLFALDGHHRIQAAREAGLEHFPARVWDRDAEKASGAWKGEPLAVNPMDMPQRISRPQRPQNNMPPAPVAKKAPQHPPFGGVNLAK